MADETYAERIARLDAEYAAQIAADERADAQAEIDAMFSTEPPPAPVEAPVAEEPAVADDPAGLFSERFGARNVMDVVDAAQGVSQRQKDAQHTDSQN
ncbi:hypothetical protein LCGC14_1367020 [marine sediment metagenome]|uniref:Uncharacterized protein n=1 Tax=marine sediment metagenome TaxID=412755 RepID=A0A0F9KSG6_9ZZZZ